LPTVEPTANRARTRNHFTHFWLKLSVSSIRLNRLSPGIWRRIAVEINRQLDAVSVGVWLRRRARSGRALLNSALNCDRTVFSRREMLLKALFSSNRYVSLNANNTKRSRVLKHNVSKQAGRQHNHLVPAIYIYELSITPFSREFGNIFPNPWITVVVPDYGPVVLNHS